MTIDRDRRRRMIVSMLLGGRTYQQRVMALAPLAYFPMSEGSGTTLTDLTGVYTVANAIGVDVVLGAAGPAVVGHTAMTFDSANAGSEINFRTAALQAAFDPSLLTAWSIGIWYKPDGWVTGTYLFRLFRDASNLVQLQKDNTNDRMVFTVVAGGTADAIGQTNGQTTTDWNHTLLTWDTTAGEMKMYTNGAQTSTTQTGLGTFAGTWVNNGMWLGANESTPAWIGGLCEFTLWSRALTLAEAKILAGI